MIIQNSYYNLFLTIASVISTLIFCVGFFPLAIVKNVDDMENPFYDSKVNRSVLMIIDALRLDFMQHEQFAFVHELIEKKEGCFLQLTVNLPTVTKPRIKVGETSIFLINFLSNLNSQALTSGMIPSFLDVAMNFGNDEMKIDTFLHQLHKKKEKIVFAGDDTWKMFNFFDREYPNSDSLFVNDFFHGDRNVTDSMKFELKNDDWRLLILRKL